MYVCLRQRFGGFCLAEKDKYALIGVTGLDANARDLSPTWFKGSSESHRKLTLEALETGSRYYSKIESSTPIRDTTY